MCEVLGIHVAKALIPGAGWSRQPTRGEVQGLWGAGPKSRQAVCEKLSFSVAQGRATCRSMAQREKRSALQVRRDSAKQGVEMEATKIMALKFKLKSKDEVPAELVNLYVERDGAWLLDVDGAVEKAKLEEFRATNVALMKERDELKQRFEGIDADEVRKVADEKRKLEEAQQIKAGEVEKVVEARVRAIKGDLDKKLASAAGERDALNARLTAIQIDQAVVTEATMKGSNHDISICSSKLL